MNGTIESKLQRTLLVLVAALAFTGFGCVEPVSPDEGDEVVASGSQELGDGDGTPAPGGIVLPGSDVADDGDDGGDASDPQPQPWTPTSRESGDPGPDPGPDPMIKTTTTGAPSGGHHNN